MTSRDAPSQIGRNNDKPVRMNRQIPPTPTSPEPPIEEHRSFTNHNAHLGSDAETEQREAFGIVEGDVAEAAEGDESKGLVTPKRLDVLSAK